MSTAEIESIVSHGKVAEAAVIGQSDDHGAGDLRVLSPWRATSTARMRSQSDPQRRDADLPDRTAKRII
jgi:hypothetical protein